MKLKKTIPFACISVLVVLIISGCTNTDSAREVKPNIVIILADDLGYGDISSYSDESVKTPYIDNLATEGVKCNDFYVPTPYCAPSRATLLTGRFPLRHKLIKNPTPDADINDIGIADSEILLSEVLKENGYKTKCIGKWHLGHKKEFFPVNHGFDEYYGILYSNDMRPVQIIEDKDTVEYPVDQSLLTQKYTNKALEFISKQKDNRFFLYLSHAMPHKPLAASEKFYTPDTKDDLYADVIRELDWSVGEIIKTLKELEILDNTIVIFMSDNGPWYGGSTGGLKGMKATTWEGGIRVPFIIRYPKEFQKASEVNVPCWSPDIFPTLLSLAQITAAPQNYLDGRNITGILKGNENNHPAVFSMHNDQILSVRKSNYKLFVKKPRSSRLPMDWVDSRAPDGQTIIAPFEQATPDQYPGIFPQKPDKDIQLFDLEKDSKESVDLSNKHPEKVKELLKEYNMFRNSLTLNE